MKQVFKKIISFLLSACIIIISVMLCPVSVQASGVMMGRVDLNLVEGSNLYLETGDSSKLIEAFKHNISIAKSVILSFNAVATGDAINYITASESVLDAIPGNLTASEEGGVVIGADLVAAIKQALIEYSQETNGFYLLPTTDYRTVPAEWFNTAPEYRTFKNIVEEKGAIVAGMHRNSTESFRFVAPFNDPDTPIALVCFNGSVNKLKDNPRTIVSVYLYGFDDWELHKYRWQVFPSIDTVYHTCDVSVDYPTSNSNYMNCNSSSVNFTTDITSWSQENPIIYSTTGEKMRVFVSASAMKNYSVGTRTVYFGKDFYDYTPADITATWDEINDRISHIDDILSELLDKIGDSDDEDKIADLLQEILDAIKNGGGSGDNQGGGNTGTGGGGYDDRTLLSVLGGYFSSVLGYLEDISYTLKGLVWIEADNKLEGDKSDLFDLIDKIWKDPETGSQEAADTLTGSFSEIASGITKKFPFSIPWDIYSLFTVFSGTPPPDTATYRTVTLGVQPFTVDEEDLEQDVHEAPYFVLPLRIDSFRIYEEVVIDLKDFKSVSKLSRGLLAALFAVFLIKFTIRIIELFRGGVDD